MDHMISFFGRRRGRPAAQAGDAERAWFEVLYRSHVREILRFGVRLHGNRVDAEDLTAEVFSTAWRRRAERDRIDNQRAWLYGVARGVAANQRRGARRRNDLVLKVGGLFDEAPDAINVAVEAAHESALIREALERLSASDSELLVLSVWEELPRSEIADVLKIRPETVSVRLTRAKSRLGDAITQIESERRSRPTTQDGSTITRRCNVGRPPDTHLAHRRNDEEERSR